MQSEPDTLFRVFLGHEIRPDRALVEGETVDPARAVAIVADAFPAGFSAFEGFGGWRTPAGVPIVERSTVYEILATQDDAGKVRALALRLKAEFRQDSVLVTASPAPVVSFL